MVSRDKLYMNVSVCLSCHIQQDQELKTCTIKIPDIKFRELVKMPKESRGETANWTLYCIP